MQKKTRSQLVYWKYQGIFQLFHACPYFLEQALNRITKFVYNEREPSQSRVGAWILVRVTQAMSLGFLEVRIHWEYLQQCSLQPHASSPSQVLSNNSERECSCQKVFEATKTTMSDILKCYYNLTKNGNIKSATSVNTRLLHRHFTSF